ncbi:MAG TPA: hypothetical protein VMF62_05665 [Acetobacteraceae bacterium]|jgi:FkbH-like protein|nr:hypothetical protein [Acetobacteraceae bacterium]
MVEPVRLVIWDLDETFWKGTLTEGGIEYLQPHHDIVIELARRGILSSICSKNDMEPVKSLLIEKGLWDYFIFPSVNWQPKGPRLQALVEAVQLRPPTILFIDDNPMNRNEALHYVPDLQVSDETIIPSILANSLFKGKDDSRLKRLGQYKLLESRKRDQEEFGDDSAFLRASGIRVTFEHDFVKHIDRAVELINRTNQLNFTKNRLPEDPLAARRELEELLSQQDVQAGLVHVRDRYGDYGYIGLYVMRSNATGLWLLHFCFSCRTLGMAVEAWVFDRLARPRIRIRGEVLTDLFAKRAPIDWINASSEAAREVDPELPLRILVRGGCDMSCVAHYLNLNAREVAGEFNIIRSGLPIRRDHSWFLRYALEGLPGAEKQAAREIGYLPEDFTSRLAEDMSSLDACIFSFWQDAIIGLYHHRELDLRLPFILPHGKGSVDVTARDEAELREWLPTPDALAASLKVRRNYRYFQPTPSAFRENLEAILSHVPERVVIFFLLGAEERIGRNGQLVALRHLAAHNRTISEVVAGRANVHLLRITEFVEGPEDMLEGLHFSRMVYYRLYRRVESLLRLHAERHFPEMASAEPAAA